jgi:hypothetical protein
VIAIVIPKQRNAERAPCVMGCSLKAYGVRPTADSPMALLSGYNIFREK